MNEFKINVLSKLKKTQKRKDFAVSIIMKSTYKMRMYIDLFALVKLSFDRDLKLIEKKLRNNK